MALKTATSDFENTYKGYLIKTDNGFVSNHVPSKRAVDINDHGKIFLTSEDASQAYADAHYVQSRTGAFGREWPQNIRIMETPLSLVALSATCTEISKMANTLNGTSDPRDSLTSKFFELSSELGLKGQALMASKLHFVPSGLLKRDLTECEKNLLNLCSFDDAETMLADMNEHHLPTDGNIMTHNFISGATLLAHDFAMTSSLVNSGFMARNPRIMMGMLVASEEAAKPAKMPITEENTSAHIKILREMKKMAL